MFGIGQIPDPDNVDEGVLALKIIRTVFQDSKPSSGPQQFILILDMEEDINLSTKDISGLADKMATALPGIFPDDNSKFVHNCGGNGTNVSEHSFRDEIEQGTNIPHLLEHILLHLLSRRSCSCSAFCGQRSTDIEQGILTHFYLVLDCPSKIESIVAAELGFHLVQSWIEDKDAIIDPAAVFDGIRQMIGPMLSQDAT